MNSPFVFNHFRSGSKIRHLIVCFLSLTSVQMGYAQTGTDFMVAMKRADCVVPFDVDAQGTEYKVCWGMDAAWDWDYNVNRGITHIGVGNFGTGRVSFQPNDLVTDNGDGTYELTDRQKKKLKWRCDLIAATGTTNVNINCDHEALFCQADANGDYTTVDGQRVTDYTGRTNYRGKSEEWYKLIKASVAYVESLGLDVVSISPFNEPDYVWEQATSEAQAKVDFLAIAKLLKADSYFDNIRICGGNTLNCDKGLTWYNYLSEYLDEGNTHQLAGSFANYADFFAQVSASGDVATADELHNVGEAIVGVNYGMTNGIWWGFDSKARGQFCLDSNEGVRLGYGENRSAWTNAAVYRNNTTGEVHGYFGSSERQAAASSFQYVSTTRDVYFNGYGPTRSFVYNVPAYKGAYQYGQINAERLFDVTWGTDVAPSEVNGTYKIANAYSKKMLTFNGTGNVQSAMHKSSGTTQQWQVTPVYTDAEGEVLTDADGNKYISFGEGVSGDVSYWFIDYAAIATSHLNVLNNNLKAGAGVICYNAGHGINEQWYLKYAKDGYYYIISRLSNKYMYCSSSSSGVNITLQDAPAENITETNLKKYLWRFQPVTTKADFISPAAPTDLWARQRVASIQLNWTEASDNDPLTYTILRGVGDEWNTIGRNVSGSTFIDNTVVQGNKYRYAVFSVDAAGNRSAVSDTLDAAPLDEKALICQLQFDGDLKDLSADSLNASSYGTIAYTTLSSTRKSGTKALSLISQAGYVQIPYSATHLNEMTIALWAGSRSTTAWQRIFDFGNGTDSYMFLTPTNGSEMRFVMKNGGDEEILSSSPLGTSGIKHIALTFAPTDGNTTVTLYIDGESVATKEFSMSPADIAASLAYIGRSMFPSDPLFKGYIDDVRIYNYALSADEVAGLMTDTGNISVDIKDIYEDTNPTGIGVVRAATKSTSATLYNAAGQPVDKSYRGIVITDGVKKLNK